MTEENDAELPEQKPKIGHWIYDSFYGGFYKCSVCGYTKGSKSDTCPDCGSDNRERKE